MSGTLKEKPRGIAAFDIEGTLGGLAKWLRILGFDAACPRSAPSRGRTFVSMRHGLAYPESLVVSGRSPLEQLKQVLEQTGVRPDPDLFLSRCVVCNELVQPVPLERVAGKVPDPVLETVSTFSQCPRCGRIYWEGSHPERMLKRLEDAGVPLF
jgi:uncharacterized protein with PIN domain